MVNEGGHFACGQAREDEPGPVVISIRELRCLAEESETRKVSQGEVLFRQGDEGDKAYFIRSGQVEIYSELRGHRQILAHRKAGEFFGEMALLGSGRRGASARTLQPTVLRSLSRKGLLRLMEGRPEVGLALVQTLVSRMNELQSTMMGHLTDRIEELQSLNEHLEERIQERTAELQDANQRLSQASITDYLTGAYNRRHLHAHLEQRCQDPRPFGLIMLDIDHFKKFNDSHGHQAGDELLQVFSRLVRCQLSTDDLLARYGGEEFTAVVEVADGANLLKVAERICRAVSERAHPGAKTQPLGHLSCSGGLAMYPQEGVTGEALMRVADARLYQAKEGGRNRIVSV